MKTSQKFGVTLAALAALGLASGQAVHAQTQSITYAGSILGQSDLAQVATDGYSLFNFTGGDDFGSDSLDGSPLAPYFTSSNGHYYFQYGSDLTEYGGSLAPASPGLQSTEPSYVTQILNYTSGSSVGGYAHVTDSVDGTDGYLGTTYITSPVADPNNPLAFFELSSLGPNGQPTNLPASLTVGFLVSGNAAPGSITLSNLYNSSVTATATPVPVASGADEADYYLFTIQHPFSTPTGVAGIQDFEFTGTANTEGYQEISGLTFGTPTAAITPPASVPEASSFIGFGILLSLGGLSIVACRRSAKAGSPSA